MGWGGGIVGGMKNESFSELVRRLESAHSELVAARKLAAMGNRSSFEDIGIAIDHIENGLDEEMCDYFESRGIPYP
jgi:hypothetical protein